MIDNHIYWGNDLGIDTRRVVWRRVVDMNDRALRQITASLEVFQMVSHARRALTSQLPQKLWQFFV